jgi:iron(III) transport system permease protein
MNATAEAGQASATDRKSGDWFGYPPVVVCLVGFLLAVMLPPLIYLVQVSFYTTNFDGSFGEFTTKYYTQLFTNPRFLNNFINTCIYSSGSAVIAISIGVLQAWIVERTNTPLRQYMFLISILSLGIPQVLYTIAWLLILGKSGPINDLMRTIMGTNDVYVNVYSMWGMILVEGFTWGPLSFLLLSSVFRSADASFEEASMMSGAGIGQTFTNITVRLAMPAILALVMLIVIRAFEAFEIPALVGMPGRVRVLTTDIYEAVHISMPANYGQAGAFSIVLLLIVVVMLNFYNRLSRYAERFQTITGKGFRPRLMNLGKYRYVTSAILVLFFILLIVLPIGIVLLASLQPFYEKVNAQAFMNITTKNYVQVFRSGSFRDSIGNTLILGVVTATITCTLTAIFAWLAVRRFKGAWILDQLATAPLIFPAIVMGVAFMQVYLNLPFPFYGTLASVIFASMVRYLPYGMRYSYAGVLQIHDELEEASAISGARMRTTFIRIVIPLILPAMITCWLFVFLLSVRAVSMAILLVGPNSQIVAVTLFDLWANGQTAELAAMGFTWMMFMTFISAIFYVVARRYGLTVQ